jgi:tRNA(fMet)-specific endonuclease VapC
VTTTLKLLDTDILSEVIKQRDAHVIERAAVYLQNYGVFAFSAFTKFEVDRGFKEKQAIKLIERFRLFCGHSLILPVSDEVLTIAADLWVLARRLGRPHGDADLVIAATALDSQRDLVTGNVSHFDWVPGLIVENWRQP